MKTLILLLALSSPCFAENAKAVISGPTDGVPGDLIELDFSESVADKIRYYVDPPRFPDGKPTYKPARDGKSIWLASRPGIYRIELLVSNAEGPDRMVQVVTIFTPMNPPPPTPIPIPQPPVTPPVTPPVVPPVTPPVIPPVQPPTVPALGAWVRDAATALVTKDPGRQATATALANAYKQFAIAGAGLADPVMFAKSQDTLNTIILTQRQRTAEWADFRKALADKLVSLQLKTVADHVQAWGEIVSGLEAVR